MPTPPNSTMTVREAVTGRKSVRGFKPDPIPAGIVRQILDEAARAPSGTNTQPWLVHVAIAAARDRLVAALTERPAVSRRHTSTATARSRSGSHISGGGARSASTSMVSPVSRATMPRAASGRC